MLLALHGEIKIFKVYKCAEMKQQNI